VPVGRNRKAKVRMSYVAGLTALVAVDAGSPSELEDWLGGSNETRLGCPEKPGRGVPQCCGEILDSADP